MNRLRTTFLQRCESMGCDMPLYKTILRATLRTRPKERAVLLSLLVESSQPDVIRMLQHPDDWVLEFAEVEAIAVTRKGGA